MNRHLKRTFVFLTLCAAFVLAPPLSRAAGTGRTIYVGPKDNLVDVVAGANNGDTIVLNAGCHVTLKNDTPWKIDKAVTFQGGDITLWVGGIILDADVTFRNTSLGFGAFVRNAIMANGHTLTLENVICQTNDRPLNLFCGGLYDKDLGSTECRAGTIIIRGKTSLEGSINTVTNEVGNIYAGNLCMGGMSEAVSGVNGPDNVCRGNARIIIEADSTSTLGRIYAGGAQQKIPSGQVNGKVILPDPKAYKVEGAVNVQLHAATVDYVNGLGAKETHVTYTDTREAKYVTDTLGVYRVSSLTVKSGHVSPAADSSFVEGAALAVEDGAKLGLEQMGNVTVGSFSGGGALCLGQRQTLTIEGDVSQVTSVVVGGFNAADGSLRQPTTGHIYIMAPFSQETSFVFAPPAGQPDIKFAYDGASGKWFYGDSAEETPVIARSLRFAQEGTVLASGQNYVGLDLIAEFMDNSSCIQFLPLNAISISVNADLLKLETVENFGDAFPYTVNGITLLLYLAEDVLCIEVKNFSANTAIPDGEYLIKLTVPGEHTASGDPLTASATLKVGGDGVIGGITPGEGAANNTVRIYLAAPAGPVKAGTVMAAVYDEKGRLLSFGEVPFPEISPEDEGVSVEVPVALSGGKTVRVFAADERKPLCQSQSVSLS